MSNNKFKGFDHTYFVLVGDAREKAFKGGSITLMSGYVDSNAKVQSEKGKYVQYVKNRNDRGQDVPYRFKLNESLARLMVREYDKDYYGVTQYDWLKNYPGCEGSPYGSYTIDENGFKIQTGVIFRELNTKADAEVALKADKLRTDAQAEALALEEDVLQEVAAVLGHYGEPDAVMRLKVLEFAGKKPHEFKELMNAGDRGLRALVRRAIAEEVFTTKGSMIFWESTTIGADEDAAIARLMSDPTLTNGLKEKLGLYTEPIEKPKVGNPNWRKPIPKPPKKVVEKT